MYLQYKAPTDSLISFFLEYFIYSLTISYLCSIYTYTIYPNSFLHSPSGPQHFLLLSSCPLIFLIAHWDQFVLLVCARVWGHPSEHGQHTSSHTQEESDSPLSVGSSSSVRDGLSQALPYTCEHADWPILHRVSIFYESKCNGQVTFRKLCLTSLLPLSYSYILSTPYSVFPKSCGRASYFSLVTPVSSHCPQESFPDFPPLASLSLIKCETSSTVTYHNIFKGSVGFPLFLYITSFKRSSICVIFISSPLTWCWTKRHCL